MDAQPFRLLLECAGDTLVSPLHSNGSTRSRAADHDGAAMEVARRWKDRTHSELVVEAGRARLVISGRQMEWRNSRFPRPWPKARAESFPFIWQGRVQAALTEARAFAMSTAVECQAPGESSHLCTKCKMHFLVSLLLRLS